jgi:hypothetical protein
MIAKLVILLFEPDSGDLITDRPIFVLSPGALALPSYIR